MEETPSIKKHPLVAKFEEQQQQPPSDLVTLPASEWSDTNTTVPSTTVPLNIFEQQLQTALSNRKDTHPPKQRKSQSKFMKARGRANLEGQSSAPVPAGTVTHWKPTKKQTEALVRSEFEILYGGARGGGKTDAGQAWLLYHKDHPRFRGLVIRKNATDLNDWVSRAKSMYRPTGAVFTANPAQIVFPSGATIVLGHLKDENAYDKYHGHEYHNILIEELTQIPTEESYQKLISTCRSTIPELRPQIFCTTNPGGRGHKWVKQRFGIAGTPRDPILTHDPITGRKRVFIPARVDDNEHIMKNDPSYVNFLNGLPDGLREAWRDGSWDDVEIKGAYYAKMLLQARLEGRISAEHRYNPEYPVHTVWDIGVSDNTVIGFFQRYKDKVYIIDFYETNNEGLPHYIKLLKDKPYVYGRHFAPHDIEVREQTTGKTRKETARKLGIEFQTVPKLATDDGINAARLMFSRFYINEPACTDFLEAMRQYRKEWDEKTLTFKDKPVHDWTSHPADMFRYAAVSENDMVNEEELVYEQEEYNGLYPQLGV